MTERKTAGILGQGVHATLYIERKRAPDKPKSPMSYSHLEAASAISSSLRFDCTHWKTSEPGVRWKQMRSLSLSTPAAARNSCWGRSNLPNGSNPHVCLLLPLKEQSLRLRAGKTMPQGLREVRDEKTMVVCRPITGMCLGAQRNVCRIIVLYSVFCRFLTVPATFL